MNDDERTTMDDNYTRELSRLVSERWKRIKQLEAQAERAREMYETKYDECVTLEAANMEMRANSKDYGSTLQRWVDRYEAQGRDLDHAIETADQRQISINVQAAKIVELRSWNDDNAAKVQELAQVNKTRLKQLETLGEQVGALGKLASDRRNTITIMTKKNQKLQAMLDTEAMNDMTVQELETQAHKIGEQVQVMLQQLHNQRTEW